MKTGSGSGKSLNYVGSKSISSLVIEIAKSTGNGTRQSFKELKRIVGEDVHLLVDHDKIVVNLERIPRKKFEKSVGWSEEVARSCAFTAEHLQS